MRRDLEFQTAVEWMLTNMFGWACLVAFGLLLAGVVLNVFRFEAADLGDDL